MRQSWRTWQPVKENLHLPGLKEMLATSKEGECPFCGEPSKRRSTHPIAVKSRARTGSGDYFLTCAAEECITAYHRCHNRDRYKYARPFKKVRGQRKVRKYTRHLSDPSGRP